MKVEIPDLTGAECGDIAITAAEGGIGYWSQIETYDWPRWSQPDDSMGNIEVEDDFVFYRIAWSANEIDVYDWSHGVEITPTLLRRGFQKMLDAPPATVGWAGARMLSIAREDWTGEIDSEMADMIVQFGVFGEVVYG